MEEKFLTFEIEHSPRNENRFANALAALGSQIMFEGDSTRVFAVHKWAATYQSKF